MAEELDFEKFEPEGDAYIATDKWGVDHWSVLTYVYTCAIDRAGMLDNRRMRTNLRIHRTLAGVHFGRAIDGGDHATRVKGGEVQEHDDWSCLEDACAAGLVEVYIATKYPEEFFGSDVAKVVFTQAGIYAANSLLAHKAGGGNFRDFVYIEEASRASN